MQQNFKKIVNSLLKIINELKNFKMSQFIYRYSEMRGHQASLDSSQGRLVNIY